MVVETKSFDIHILDQFASEVLTDFFITIAVDILKTIMIDKIPSDLEGMEVSMQRLLALIDGMCNYVDDVVVSKMAPFICSNLPVA